MALGGDRNGTRADTAALITCVVLSLIALALPEGLREPVAGTLRSTVLSPALSLEGATVRSAENRERVELLRAERDSLALGAAFLPQLQAENARLRGLLALGARLGTGFVTAEVLHQAGSGDAVSLVLSAGRDKGITPLAPVVAPDGLVGMIHRVDAHTSVALAWTHPDFRASAMVPGQKVYGIVYARRDARSGEMMELHGVAYREQLELGTPVVTSGLGGILPRGIPVGTVQGVLRESAGWERTYLLRPAVHPAEASHVMILMPARSHDTLTTAFDTVRADTARTTPVRPAPRPRRPAAPATDTAPAVTPVPTDTNRRH